MREGCREENSEKKIEAHRDEVKRRVGDERNEIQRANTKKMYGRESWRDGRTKQAGKRKRNAGKVELGIAIKTKEYNQRQMETRRREERKRHKCKTDAWQGGSVEAWHTETNEIRAGAVGRR